MRIRIFCIVMLATFELLAQAPQRTSSSGSKDTSSPPVSGTDAVSEAYRKQWDRMSESERKQVVEMGGYTPEQQRRSLVNQRPVQSTPAPGPLTPARPGDGTTESPDRSTNTARPDLNKSLADLDAIRDRYIDRAGSGNCPPAILTRMADLKWKLGQKGISVSGLPHSSAAANDFVAIGQDWFKAGDAAALPEVREPGLDDILPSTLVTSRRGAAGRRDDEDPEKMRAEYDALYAACSDQAGAPGSGVQKERK